MTNKFKKKLCFFFNNQKTETKKKDYKKNKGRSFFGIFYFCKKGTIRRDTKKR